MYFYGESVFMCAQLAAMCRGVGIVVGGWMNGGVQTESLGHLSVIVYRVKREYFKFEVFIHFDVRRNVFSTIFSNRFLGRGQALRHILSPILVLITWCRCMSFVPILLVLVPT